MPTTPFHISHKDQENVIIDIVVSVEDSKVLCSMSDSRISNYVRLLNKIIGVKGKEGLDSSNLRQLYGEIQLHIEGWKIGTINPFKDNCAIIELRIINNRVADPREWVKVISRFLGWGYMNE